MKTVAVVFFAVASIGLLGCPEEQVKPDPSKAAATTSAAGAVPSPAPAPAPAATTKPAEGGW